MGPTVNVTTTTNQFLEEWWIDQILRDNQLYGRILENTKRWKGSQMLFGMKYQKGNPSIAFSGFDVLPITQVPVSVGMTFFPSFVATNVALAGTEISVNSAEGNGALKVIDLVKVEMESRSQDAADDIGNFFQGDGSSYSGKAPMGLAGIVDNGSDLASYGGLSRATYGGLNATVTASSGTISLLKIRTLWNTMSDGPVTPDLILTDYTTWAYVEALLTPFQRNTISNFEVKGNKTASASGYTDLMWDGMRITRDKKVTAGNFYMLNMDTLKFHGLKWWKGTPISSKGSLIKENVYEDRMYNPTAFTWTGWIDAYNAGSYNSFIIFAGQLICTAPFRNGVLTGITGF